MRQTRLAWLLAALMLVALLPQAVFARDFTDLAGHWAAADVQFLADKGVVRGFPDGGYHPEAPTTRGEYMALLARVIGLQPVEVAPPNIAFVPADHWAVPTARALAARDILSPDDGNPLDLSLPVSRREMARWITLAETWSRQLPPNTWLTDLPGDRDAAGLTAVVAHGIFTGYPDRTVGPGRGATRAEVAATVARLLDVRRRPAAWREAFTVGSVQLNVVAVNPQRVTAKVMLGADHVGGAEGLDSMAARAGALAAINGTYFQAYDSRILPEPYGTMVTGGQPVHMGGGRAAVGFFGDGRIGMATINPHLTGKGATGDYRTNWYADGMNHNGRAGYGDSWSVVFTPAHGTDMGFSEGSFVTVRGGVVTEVATTPPVIPPDGFVVALGGAELSQLHAFQVGQPAAYGVDLGPAWQGVSELLEVGPRLVAGGKPALDLAGESFTEAKITTLAWARSIIALTDSGVLLLMTSPAATVSDLANLLPNLGVVDAMCLDSGASSGLYLNGGLVTQPGRALSNALVFTANG